MPSIQRKVALTRGKKKGGFVPWEESNDTLMAPSDGAP